MFQSVSTVVPFETVTRAVTVWDAVPRFSQHTLCPREMVGLEGVNVRLSPASIVCTAVVDWQPDPFPLGVLLHPSPATSAAPSSRSICRISPPPPAGKPCSRIYTPKLGVGYGCSRSRASAARRGESIGYLPANHATARRNRPPKKHVTPTSGRPMAGPAPPLIDGTTSR